MPLPDWDGFAQEVGGRRLQDETVMVRLPASMYYRPSWEAVPADCVRWREGDCTLTAGRYTDREGMPVLWARTAFFNPSGFGFRLRGPSRWERFKRVFGWDRKRFRTGHLCFDRATTLETTYPEQTRRLIARPGLLSLIRCNTVYEISVSRMAAGPGVSLPVGLSVLLIEALGEGSPDELFWLRKLAVELLEAVDVAIGRPEDTVLRLIENLSAPLVRVVGFWDGEARCRETLQALATWKDARATPAVAERLRSPILALRAESIETLARLRDPAAARPLLRTLGDFTVFEKERLHARAVKALRSLADLKTERGPEHSLEAFLAALAGDESCAGKLEAWRDDYLPAVLQALRTGAIAQRVAAARLLQLWDVRSALQDLRNLAADLRGHDSGALDRVERIVHDLEDRALLPRPSAAPPMDPTRLPVPAGDRLAPDRNLPRIED